MRSDCVGVEFVQCDTDDHHQKRVLAESRHECSDSDEDHRDVRRFEEGIVGEKTPSPTMRRRRGSISEEGGSNAAFFVKLQCSTIGNAELNDPDFSSDFLNQSRFFTNLNSR